MPGPCWIAGRSSRVPRTELPKPLPAHPATRDFFPLPALIDRHAARPPLVLLDCYQPIRGFEGASPAPLVSASTWTTWIRAIRFCHASLWWTAGMRGALGAGP